jgi:hypothetical protein
VLGKKERRNKSLEERIGAAVRAEFAGLIAELERDLREYRHRSRLKEESCSALEKAETETRRLHLARVELKKRFWEAYYGKDEPALSKIGRELRSVERAMKKAEKSLEKARANFEKADFDEETEAAALREKADAAGEKADLRINALEKALESVLADTWREVKGASAALHDGCEKPRRGAVEEETAREKSA